MTSRSPRAAERRFRQPGRLETGTQITNVGRRTANQRQNEQGGNLKADPLSHREPMQQFPDIVRDVRVSWQICNHPGSTVQDGLELAKSKLRQTLQDGVTVINSCQNKRMNQCKSSGNRKIAPNTTNLTQLIKTGSAECIDMVGQGVFAIKKDAQVTYYGQRGPARESCAQGIIIAPDHARRVPSQRYWVLASLCKRRFAAIQTRTFDTIDRTLETQEGVSDGRQEEYNCRSSAYKWQRAPSEVYT